MDFQKPAACAPDWNRFLRPENSALQRRFHTGPDRTVTREEASIRSGPQGPTTFLAVGEDLLQVLQEAMGEGDSLLVAGSMDR